MYNDKVTLSNSNFDDSYCPGGILLHLLTAILFTAVSKYDGVSFNMETYNGKSTGVISRTHGKVADKDQIFKELVDKGKKQASMIILEIISILRDLLKPHVTEVLLSVGLVAVGTILHNGSNEMALIEFGVLEWVPEIKNFRHNNISDIFKIPSGSPIANDIDSDDDSNDSSYEEAKQPILGLADNVNSSIRLSNCALIRSKEEVAFYHLCASCIPITQAATVTVRPVQNKFAKILINAESEITRVQSYIPGLRNKGGTSISDIHSSMNNGSVLDLQVLENSIKKFGIESRKRISNMTDPESTMPSRVEVTASVRKTKDGIMTSEVIKKDLFLLISDVKQILDERVTGRPASSITKKINFGVDALVGIGTALVKMLGTPDSVKNLDRIEQIMEFEEISKTFLSAVTTFWSGKVSYKLSLLYSSILSIYAGRNIFSPYCRGIQEILKNSLPDKVDDIYEKLNIRLISLALDAALESRRFYYDNPMSLLALHHGPKKISKNDKTSMCMICNRLFETNDLQSDDIKLHPCRRLDHQDVERANSVRVEKFLAEQICSLNPDQRNILEAILTKKNVILVAAAGCGKTHVLRIIALILKTRISIDAVILTAMYNNIANDIDGNTFHSFLKLGLIAPSLEGSYVYNTDHNIKGFVEKKFSDAQGTLRLQEIRKARIFIIDEVTYFFIFAFLFFYFLKTALSKY